MATSAMAAIWQSTLLKLNASRRSLPMKSCDARSVAEFWFVF